MAAAKPGAWQYHSEVLTDQSPEEVCTNLIREKLLEYLPQEVPYSLTQVSPPLWLSQQPPAGATEHVQSELLLRPVYWFCFQEDLD